MSLEDIERWKQSLDVALAQIADHSTFRLIADFCGYAYAHLSAHKAMRTIVPITLSQYGFRTALLDLFDQTKIPIIKTRGISCIAVGHVHHDADKMGEYERRLGQNHERFFTDYADAERWILHVDIAH